MQALLQNAENFTEQLRCVSCFRHKINFVSKSLSICKVVLRIAKPSFFLHPATKVISCRWRFILSVCCSSSIRRIRTSRLAWSCKINVFVNLPILISRCLLRYSSFGESMCFFNQFYFQVSYNFFKNPVWYFISKSVILLRRSFESNLTLKIFSLRKLSLRP